MNTTIRTKLYTAISCVMGTAALCTALSTSVEAEDAPSKTVRFRDLDITKSDGAKVLYSRIRAAARDGWELSTTTGPIFRMAIKGCLEKARHKAGNGRKAP